MTLALETYLLRLALLAVLIALLPLGWLWLRRRGGDGRTPLAALTALTLFLTFDLVVFGAFTRLTDSGLGCPDWPGCYAHASPLGARDSIELAQSGMPGGPVTWSKAWIEMIHRYLAMTVGLLIVLITVASWMRLRRSPLPPVSPISPLWPTASLLWVVVQGLFGKYTVTLKLYPLVVSLHLIGGLVLLALLAIQHAAFLERPLVLPWRLRRAVLAASGLVMIQIGLGAWVSTNYAVLACTGFPRCNGAWWPSTDFGAGFSLLRELGHTAEGLGLPFEALVAIQLAHRFFAVVAAIGVAWAAWRLVRAGNGPVRDFGKVLAGLLLLQFLTGLSNVVLGWPLVAALGHTAGAAALVATLTLLLARSAPPQALRVPGGAAALA